MSVRVVITGMGHYHPPTILDNDFFDSLDIGSAAAWVEDRTGIRERRTIMSREQILMLRRGETTALKLFAEGKIGSVADIVDEAWTMAKARRRSGQASDRASDVALDMLVSGNCAPEMDVPAHACKIAARLGIACAAFDLNSACSTFVVNVHTMRGVLSSGVARAVAVFNPERFTTKVDYTDRTSAILWGDASAATIIEADTAGTLSGLEVVDSMIDSNPAKYDTIRIPYAGYFFQNGSAVQKFAISQTVDITKDLLQKHGLGPKDVAYFIGHQANLRMLATSARMIGFNEEQHLYNVDTRGNQGGAGAPVVLSTFWERFKPGDYIVVAVVGAGLTWGSMLLRRI